MTPKILEYTDGRIVITPEAFMIKELNDIINKHGDGTSSGGGAEPYLAYVHLMTWPESPYINLPEEEISDTVQFDITQTIGDFDIEDELIQPAVERLARQWQTKAKRYYDSLSSMLDKQATWLKSVEIEHGREGNLSDINRMIEKAGVTLKSFKQVEKEVDEELKTKMRGKSTLGEY